jgi:hypothetical protein
MAEITKLGLACYDEWLKNVIIMMALARSTNAEASVQVFLISCHCLPVPAHTISS